MSSSYSGTVSITASRSIGFFSSTDTSNTMGDSEKNIVGDYERETKTVFLHEKTEVNFKIH